MAWGRPASPSQHALGHGTSLAPHLVPHLVPFFVARQEPHSSVLLFPSPEGQKKIDVYLFIQEISYQGNKVLSAI